MDAFIIIITGILVAWCCGLLGSLLILRKMTMIGDAISHAVLPGIVIGYLISGNKSSVSMLLAASLMGTLATVLIEFLSKRFSMQADAAIGISFTWLFALGIILISVFAGEIDLDQDCVLYGEIAYVPLNTWYYQDINMGPADVWMLSGLLICISLFMYFGYKGLIITSFDPNYASALGIKNMFWHYSLMVFVSITTVFSFESVGAIIVVAFLAGPPATAYLLTKRFKPLLALTMLFGVTACIFGYLLAIWLNGSISGAISICIGLQFFVATMYTNSVRTKTIVSA